MKTLIGVQDEFIETVNTAWQRWSHRKNPTHPQLPGGHFDRIHRTARVKAQDALVAIGLTPEQAHAVVADAWEVAALNRNATED